MPCACCAPHRVDSVSRGCRLAYYRPNDGHVRMLWPYRTHHRVHPGRTGSARNDNGAHGQTSGRAADSSSAKDGVTATNSRERRPSAHGHCLGADCRVHDCRDDRRGRFGVAGLTLRCRAYAHECRVIAASLRAIRLASRPVQADPDRRVTVLRCTPAHSRNDAAGPESCLSYQPIADDSSSRPETLRSGCRIPLPFSPGQETVRRPIY
jgi:hypothetical protein